MIQKTKEISVEEEYIECYGIYNIPLYEDEKMIGRALVLNPSDREGLVLLDIYIYSEEHRGKGYGDKLMWYLTQRFDGMWTSWLSKAGRDLCLKHGFRIIKNADKKGPPILIYQKEESDGGEEKGGSEEGGSKEEGYDLSKAEAILDGSTGEESVGPGSEDGQDAQEDPEGPESKEEG